MKYKVLVNFTDKYNSSIKYKVGDIVEFSEDRANEVLKKGNLIERIIEKKPRKRK